MHNAKEKCTEWREKNEKERMETEGRERERRET